MSRIRKFVDFIKDASEVVAGLPVAGATLGGVTKVIGGSIANPQVSSKVVKAGDLLIKGSVKLAKVYAKGVGIAAKALGKGAKVATPAVKAVAKSLPGSKYVPGALKFAKVAIPAYLTVAGAVKAYKEAGKVERLTGSALDKLGSERPKFSFQSVLNTFKDALLFR